MEVKVIADKWMMPERMHPDDAGADLKADATLRIEPGRTRMVRTGTRWEIPRGYVGLVFARSSLAVEKGLMLVNGVGVIDSGYQGEVLVPLFNATGTFVTIDEGERIAQMVIVPIATPELVRVDDFDAPTDRGAGGFGSTGKWGELYDEMGAEG